MPLTTKGPYQAPGTVPESDSPASDSGTSGPVRRTDAFGAEIPVVVHASRYSSKAHGVGKNLPPVHEETRTVIVFPNGAVVRVSASLATGELVVLTNQQSGADVICRVTSVKAQAGIQNYVNLEFTQSATGFWGTKIFAESDARAAAPQSLPASPAGGASLAETLSPVTQAPLPVARAPLASPVGKTSSAEAERPVAVTPSHSILDTSLSLGLKQPPEALLQDWAQPYDSGTQAARGPSRTKKIILIATAAVALLSLGAAGGWLLLQHNRQAGQTSPNAESTQVPDGPEPNVTVRKDTLMPSQRDSSAGSALQPAVVSSDASGQPEVPKATSAVSKSAKGENSAAPVAPPAGRSSGAGKNSTGPADRGSSVAGMSTSDGPVADAEQTTASAASARNERTQPGTPGKTDPPKQISSPAPVYPEAARSQGIQGSVVIDALVDNTGRVTVMEVISGPQQLQAAAMDALREWKFEPVKLNGQAVAAHTQVSVVFRLR